MKIALLVPNYSDYSGDAKVVKIQADECSEKGNEITIFSLNSEMKSNNQTIIKMGMPKNQFLERIYRLLLPIDLFTTIKWIPRLKKFDLIISHNYPMNWLAYLAKKRYGVKYFFWYHGIPEPDTYPKLYERIYLRLFIYFTKITIKNADRIFSVSNSAKKELKNRTGLESDVIYNKVDLEKFNPSNDGSKIREKFHLSDSKVILNVGRVCPQKGADLLIKSFTLIKEEIPNVKLIIAGKHTYDYFSKQLKELSNDSVIFTGFVPDDELPDYYAACDLYATCSLWETFNIPIAEAQASGKPVVAFDIGPHAEIIDHNGILVPDINIKEFADACILKLSSIRKENEGTD